MMCLSERRSVFIVTAMVCLLAVHGVRASGSIPSSVSDDRSTWPTLHNDYQRSGYTGEMINGPYERKWYRDFHEEMIATRVEAILAEGKCYVGTFSGNLYALDVADGSTVWRFQAEGPIGHSPCYDRGRLFFGADEGFNRGHLYCLRAKDGSVIWKYDAGAGIWVSPACDGEKVYFGDRAGIFHAVRVQNGELAWTFETGNMILSPASFSTDKKKIIFASEDMHVYCLAPSGNLIWKSKKLQGLSLRDHAPTIWEGLAIVRTNPPDGFHTVLNRNGDLLKEIQRAIPLAPEDRVLSDKWNDVMMKETPERREAEQAGVVKYLKENPHDQTFYALQLEDGKEPWIAPILYTGGLHNPPTPPTFHPETGELYVYYRTALTNYLRGVRRYSALGRLNRETGLIDFSWPEMRHPQEDWYGFPLIGDETQALSMMDNILISTHQGELGGLDLTTEKTKHIWRGRDTYGGIFGPGAVAGGFEGARELATKGYLTGMPNEWHGPDRSILAIAGGRMFWVVGSHVVCLAGPGVPRTPSGGTNPPPTPRSRLNLVGGGNIARGPGGFDDAAQRSSIRQEDLEPIVNAPPPVRVKQAATPLAKKLRAMLDAEVTELTDEGPWAPFILELGIVNEQRYFWRTAETMEILSLALPHLSPSARAKAKDYLDDMFTSGMPLEVPVHTGEGANRRESYDFGPGMEEFSQRRIRYSANVEDLYAVWAYAHYADSWDKVLLRENEIRETFAPFAGRPLDFNHNDNRDDAAEHLNAQIAGTLAYVRVMNKAGFQKDAERGLSRLADLVTERVHHEQADSRLIRQSGSSHNAKIPRYVELVPEVSAILGLHAKEKFTYHVCGLAKQLPVWYQAFGERMIGGENYVSPPHLARGLFAALADGVQTPLEQLCKYLDHPWCRADMYYIEKLTAILRRLDGQEERGESGSGNQ
jgi:outer membrane protein assembly factor BamB